MAFFNAIKKSRGRLRRFVFFFCNQRMLQLCIGMAVVAIAAGQGIDATYTALVVTVYMYQRCWMAAKLAGLHECKIKRRMMHAAFGIPPFIK
jgi:hypothetical protein